MVLLPMQIGKVRPCFVFLSLNTGSIQSRLVWYILKTWPFGSWLLVVKDQSFPSFYLDQPLFHYSQDFTISRYFHHCILKQRSVWSSSEQLLKTSFLLSALNFHRFLLSFISFSDLHISFLLLSSNHTVHTTWGNPLIFQNVGLGNVFTYCQSSVSLHLSLPRKLAQMKIMTF